MMVVTRSPYVISDEKLRKLDGVTLQSESHPRPPWWQRPYWWVMLRRGLNTKALETVEIEIED
jgi:hypothetical protein